MSSLSIFGTLAAAGAMWRTDGGRALPPGLARVLFRLSPARRGFSCRDGTPMISRDQSDPSAMPDLPPVTASDDLAAQVAAWQSWLRDERRYSPHTLDAYTRDLGSFCGFLAQHLGHSPTLADLSALGRADFRSWLAYRLSANLKATSTARALSDLRTFFRYLARHGHASNVALQATRASEASEGAPPVQPAA
jgi:hypothetical protein